MIDIEKVKIEIVEKLKPLNIEKVILFGSYVYGTQTEDSDIDLYVVTNDDFMPQSFKEKSNIYLKVVNNLDDIQSRIPIDLITHTKPMYYKFIELDSMFSRKILRDGESLI